MKEVRERKQNDVGPMLVFEEWEKPSSKDENQQQTKSQFHSYNTRNSHAYRLTLLSHKH